MMTDAEIDALARELLTDAIHQVLGWNPNFFSSVLRLPDGELIPVYSGRSENGCGSFLCEFRLLDAVKTLIVESNKIYDQFILSMENKSLTAHNKRMIKSTLTKGRDRSIRLMAHNATMHLITFFHARLVDTLEEAVEDSKIIAEGFIAVSFAKALDEYAPEPIKVDARKAIDRAVKRVAGKKRTFLRDPMKNLPNLIRPGAPLKKSVTREQERREYEATIESAYRKVRAKIGKKPTKTRIAEELNIGGVDLKTGTDTRLNSFNNKLARLGIKYDAIADKLEAEYGQ
jgi:hypothetical protein